MQDVHVVGVKKALLGRPAIEALSLVSRINSFKTPGNPPGNEFIAAYSELSKVCLDSELSQGLFGTMYGEYYIKLRPVLNLFLFLPPEE